MRAIAELPHKDCKISVFSMNQKFLIKFEQGSLEQTYKISELDIIDGVNGIFQLIDEPFINSVIERFQTMRTDFKRTYDRHEY